MPKFIGNTRSLIDWEGMISSLETQVPAYVGPRHSKDDDIEGIKEMDRLWTTAGHKLLNENGTAGWDMFFPELNFDKDIVEKFSTFVNVESLSCWVSRIHPGNMTPWHWDCNDKEEEYIKLNTARFTCHISKPDNGHFVMVENTCMYNQEQGNIWEWPSRTSWHGGINCGLRPKYLFNFFGIRK